MPERQASVDSPWDDPSFVARVRADVEAEERGELDEGLTRESSKPAMRSICPATDLVDGPDLRALAY